MRKNDFIDSILDMGKDPKGREELIQAAEALKDAYYPMIELTKEVIGEDLDTFVDEALRWSARKAKVAYDAYILAGFSRYEALSLTIRSREDFANAIRSKQ